MADVVIPLPTTGGYKRRASGLTIQTDLPMSSFPELFESSGDTMMDSPSAPVPAHKLVDRLKDQTPRHPSPQPTHVSYPKVNGNGHRVLRSATVGYVAPIFQGKAEQMKQGW